MLKMFFLSNAKGPAAEEKCPVQEKNRLAFFAQNKHRAFARNFIFLPS
jgi:hypothetical protein